MMQLLSVLLIAGGALAQSSSPAVTESSAAAASTPAAAGGNAITINTPASLATCEPVNIMWTGGTAPYFLAIIPGGQVSAAPLEQFPQSNTNSYVWNVDLPAGTSVTFKVTDSTGTIAYSSPDTIQAGAQTTCAAASGVSVAPGASTAGSSGTAVVAASSSPASSAQATTSKPTSVASLSSSSSSASATSSRGAAPLKQAAGSLFGLIGAAAIALVA